MNQALRLLTERFILWFHSSYCWLCLPCLVQHLSWLQVSDYHNLWNTEGSSLKINSFLLNMLNICFSFRNVLQNGCQHFVKNDIFFHKAQNFVHIGLYELVQISPAFCPNMYQVMYGET